MPRSYAQIILHTTFSTKYRLPLISPAIEALLYAVIISEFRRHGSIVLRIGGTPDHLHIVHTLPRDCTLANLLRSVKAVSSKWIKRQGEFYERFAWQEGYASFSVDYRKKEAIIRYVDNQKEHHGLTGNGLTFEQEYLKLLRAFGIADIDLERLFPELPAA